ncbi:glycosyltransferase [Bacteroidota bacterium]
MHLFELEFSIFEASVLLIFSICFVIQMFYYLFFYAGIISKRKMQKNTKDEKESVSVIICAKNEEANLRAHLPKILSQHYPDFEVVVVDDCSHDNTLDVLYELSLKYKNLKFTSITKDDKFSHGKKLAVTIGIKAAKNEWLLFTDADCYPVSENWIQKMQENFSQDAEIVLGYGGFERKKGILNTFIRYETICIALQYLTFAIKGIPYMGAGRNMAYRKSLFFKNKGFARHYHLLSGDDDLFVNENATKKNVVIEYRPESHTLSIPAISLMDWYARKVRHMKTSKYYKFKHKILLILELLSRILFYITFIVLLAGLYINSIYIAVLAVFGIRLIIQMITMKYSMVRFNEKNLLLLAPLYDLILPLLNIFFVILDTIISDKNKWK